MTTSKERNLKPNKITSNPFDTIINKVGKANALITAVATLTTTVAVVLSNYEKIAEWVNPSLIEPSKHISNPDCFKGADLLVEPKSVPFNQFNKVKLTLKGENTCKEKIFGYILAK